MAFGDFIEVLVYLLWLIPHLVLYGGQVMVQANVSSGGETWKFFLLMLICWKSLFTLRVSPVIDFFNHISGQSMLFTFGFLVGHILEMILCDHVSCPLQGENQPWRCIALTWTHCVWISCFLLEWGYDIGRLGG